MKTRVSSPKLYQRAYGPLTYETNLKNTDILHYTPKIVRTGRKQNCPCACHQGAQEEQVYNSTHFFSKWPTWRTIPLFYITFINVLYMFRETSCSSSGSQILLTQHLVWSLTVSGAPDGHLQRMTIPDAVLIQFDFLMMSTTLLETCRVSSLST